MRQSSGAVQHLCLLLLTNYSAAYWFVLTGRNCKYFLSGFMKRLMPSLRPVRCENTSELARTTPTTSEVRPVHESITSTLVSPDKDLQPQTLDQQRQLVHLVTSREMRACFHHVEGQVGLAAVEVSGGPKVLAKADAPDHIQSHPQRGIVKIYLGSCAVLQNADQLLVDL